MIFVGAFGVSCLFRDGHFLVKVSAVRRTNLCRFLQYMEELQRSGKARDIGISNFNVQQTKHVVENAKVPVSVNQIEGHVYLQSKELWDLCKKNNIQVVTYSPLGSGDRDPKDPNCGVYPPPLEDPVVKKIADRQKKQPGQVGHYCITVSYYHACV